MHAGDNEMSHNQIRTSFRKREEGGDTKGEEKATQKGRSMKTMKKRSKGSKTKRVEGGVVWMMSMAWRGEVR